MGEKVKTVEILMKGSMQIGTDADFVIVDLDKEYTFHQESMHSRTKLSPYDGMHMKGLPRWHNGKESPYQATRDASLIRKIPLE